MNYPEVDFPILLSELYEFVAALDLNRAIVQKVIKSDIRILSNIMDGAFDGVPGLNQEQVYYLWQLIMDTCYDIKIDLAVARDFAAEITDMWRKEPREDWDYVVIGFTDAPAPLIGRKDKPC